MPARSTAPLLQGETITIELAGVPIGKGRPRSTLVWPKGRPPWINHYTPAETVAYEEALAWAGKVAMKGRKPLGGALWVSVMAFMPVPESWPAVDRLKALQGEIRPTVKPDRDNIEKIVGDGLKGIVWVDDAQIVDGPVIKLYGDPPRLVVEVMEL